MRKRLTASEKEYFVNILLEAMPHLPYEISNPALVDMYWNDRYNVDNGVLGSYAWHRKDEIDISPLGKEVPSMIVSVVAHELHHKWQYRKYGILYFLMLLPLIREFALERTADEVEKKMDELMRNEEFLSSLI
jgi:hypothetical protein